jgi:hypothetical protein
VPLGDQHEVSEDSILDFLSSQSTGANRGRQRASGTATKPAEGHVAAAHSPPKKSCGRCNREIPAQTHICPFCHAYVGGGSIA